MVVKEAIKVGMLKKILESWANTQGNVNKFDALLDWINSFNQTTKVVIKETSLSDDSFWFYDDYNGEILNRKRSFFSIKGVRCFENGEFVCEQPIIVQPEIGYLGIICKEINGVLNFLMQAKIEPGNINCVQISPTIQATKSNFTRAHGGKQPAYLEYFDNADKYTIIYDQIQSEQSSRFLKKRNRNMILLVDEDIPVLPNYNWMTLGQLKQLMKIKNLVNMDTRTVISGIPYILLTSEDKRCADGLFNDKALFSSLFERDDLQYELTSVFNKMNNYKMFVDTEVIATPLNQLVDWSVNEYGIDCKKKSNFVVRYYDIEIEGREVQHWSQPLFKAVGVATFGLISCVDNGCRKFLVKIKPEVGCFDKVEIGPSVQWEPLHDLNYDNFVDSVFRKCVADGNIIYDNLLSEEGGRFYHEQNRNVIVEVKEKIDLNRFDLNDYVWCSLSTLSFLMQANNCLNIQLRNLISLL